MTIVGTLEIRQVTFFDDEGTPSRVEALVTSRTTATNVTTGESTEDNADFIVRLDFATGIFENDGKFVNIKDEDSTRFRDIGRFVSNPETGEILFEAGPKDAGLGDSTPLLCEALA